MNEVRKEAEEFFKKIEQKFGSLSPSLDAPCNVCHERYGDHLGDECPHPKLLPAIRIPKDSNFLTCDTKVALKASAEANADEMVAYKGWAQTIAEVKKAQVYLEYMEEWIRQNINIEEQISKNGVVAAGIKIDRANSPRKFDFSVCGDPEWEILSNALRTVKEQIKNREGLLKNLEAPMAITEGKYAGTEIKPPHVTGGGSNYKCTFLKDVKEKP